MNLRNYFRLIAGDQPSVSRWAWFWKPILRIGSFFYWVGLKVHQGSYRFGVRKKHALSCPVISVGNLTWGGTGKTPIVEYVARFYLNRRNAPLILARGYGQDESKMLSRQLPDAQFGIGKDRYQAARKVLAMRSVDVAILDDGFQHWSIRRDLDVVLVNALNPFGNGSVIPRGILREPLGGLKRASLVILTDVNLTPRKELENLKAKIRTVSPKVEFVEACREALYFYRPGSRDRISTNRIQGERVTSFSGIGTPRSFQMLLNQLGIKTVRNFEFPDHHFYNDRELKEMLAVKESSESEEIITTEKDFFRCEQAMRRILNPLVLKARLRLTNGEGVFHQYLSRFARSVPFVETSTAGSNQTQNRAFENTRSNQRRNFYRRHPRQERPQPPQPTSVNPPQADSTSEGSHD
ncbi:MAG: tetraacyldisaccharide 4'-kinase [Candidatus Omnitrophica bacterium]|nr:tetraacyldisaccharide 4'-kinase [Candidatus Omnitrophota bacterium]